MIIRGENMGLSRVQLNAKKILEKDFKTAMRGYNQEEVDEFLDVIIQDYELLQKEADKLTLENDRLRKSTSPESGRTRSAQPPANQQANYDVLKRLSNLEKAVFGNKLNETEV